MSERELTPEERATVERLYDTIPDSHGAKRWAIIESLVRRLGDAEREHVTRICERHVALGTVPPGGACPHCLAEARRLAEEARAAINAIASGKPATWTFVFPWEVK